MIIWIAPVLGFLRSALPYALLFLRSIPDLIAPKPTPVSSPYVPPYSGGQCLINYNVSVRLFWTLDGIETLMSEQTSVMNGKLGATGFENLGTDGFGFTTYRWYMFRASGTAKQEFTTAQRGSGQTKPISGRVEVISVTPQNSSQLDNCGDVSNPTTPPSIPDDGLFQPQNPKIADDGGTLNPSSIVLAPAAPLVLINGLGTAIAAALAAARAAASALDAIQKVAEALEGLGKLWDKLQEFLDDWEKNRPKKRDIVRQTYGRIIGDGALDFFPDNNTKFQAIQLDVVITNIPIGFGRYFGSLSPSRYRYKELGYIAFYSVNQGILSTHSIQFKRTSYQIPELAVGFIYHLGLDEQIKGYAFGTFSVEKT